MGRTAGRTINLGDRPLINGFTTASMALIARLTHSVQTHPKRITAAVAALLLTGGGGAFAVASLAPDPSDLPVRQISYAVESLAENPTLAALEAPGFSLYRSEQTRSSDTAESLLQRMAWPTRPPLPFCAAMHRFARPCWAVRAARSQPKPLTTTVCCA